MRAFILLKKIFYLFMLISLFVIVFINIEKAVKISFFRMSSKLFKYKKMKYILQWTSPNTVPFNDMEVGQETFIKRNCSHVNCYVIANRTLLGDIKKFDVIAFAGPQILSTENKSIELPAERASHQKYVFASIESAENYPVLSNRFDSYFNWTWTYKLDSDIRWGYIVIRDSKGKIIGPKKDMHWIKLEDMDPVDEDVQKQIKKKRKAAAWFVSNCLTISKREKIAYQLKVYLQKNFQVLDIYGDCGLLSCSRDTPKKCNKMLEDTYYFYLSFENSFSEDYVTEKLLIALQNNIVPVVFGGANYSRFLPDGSYLDARKLGVKPLVEKMIELIYNPSKYFNYFRWKNHYSYHKTTESIETNEYCKMCALLNDYNMVMRTSVYEHFQTWWDGPDHIL